MSQHRIQRQSRMEGDYPATVIEVLDDDMRFRPRTLRTMKAFASLGPWSGTLDERTQKFIWLNQQLAHTHGILEPQLSFGQLNGSGSGASHYIPSQHRIVLLGRLSVVTYLHEFGHALGHDERKTARWSVTLFRRCFPRQYARLVHCGHMLLRPQDAADLSGTGSAP